MSSAPSARTQVPQTTGDTQYNVRDAALRGAFTAFSKPPVKPKPLVNTYTGGDNGALLAATKVGTGTPRNAAPQGNTTPLRRDWTGGSHAGRPNPSPMQLLSKSNSSSTLGVPDDHLLDRTPSPSNIAAKLAAARFSPMRPIPQETTKPIINERERDERDILPPAGSVSNVLARLQSRSPGPESPKKPPSTESRSAATTVRAPVKDARPTDDTPIPPTTSLVKMWEQNRQATPAKQSAEPLLVLQKAPPPVRSPKPQRKFNLPPEPIDDVPLVRTKTRTPPPVKAKPDYVRKLSLDGTQEHKNFGSLRKDSLGAPPIKQKPPLAVIKTSVPRPKPPLQQDSRLSRPKSEEVARSASFRRRASTSKSMDSNENVSSPSSFVSAQEEQLDEKPRPSLPPPRRSGKARSEVKQIETPAKSSPAPPKPRSPSKMTSPLQVPEKFVASSRSSSAHPASPPSGTIYHSNYQRESVKQVTQHMTGESLSNAIVGAALASSRNASPAPPVTSNPPLPTRKHHHQSPLHHNRSPSPPKPTGKLRTTMRKDPSSSSDEDESERYKRKGTRVMGLRRKHPNKHHEGTRKRWRDTITERERKRYEGVWAANKGLHIPNASRSPSRGPQQDDPSLDVLNIVAKEIWSRSRLPEHVLEEVWALVDGRGSGRLRREEFVVGMWLIDQSLKGRKLPSRVSESVWSSVRLAGVKVKVGHHHHHHKQPSPRRLLQH